MRLNVSTRKTIRTVYQALAAIVAATALAVPVFNMNFPKYAAVGGSILAAVAVFTKVQTSLEQNGVIPKVLDPALAPDAAPPPVAGQGDLKLSPSAVLTGHADHDNAVLAGVLAASGLQPSVTIGHLVAPPRNSAGAVTTAFLIRVLVVVAIIAVLVFLALHLSIGVHPHN